MQYEIQNVAKNKFAHITTRRERIHQAENYLVREFFQQKNDGVFVEVGANDPQKCSQTWHLEEQGWNGVLVEPIPQLCEQLSAQRPKSKIVQAACGAPSQAGPTQFYVKECLAHSCLDPSQLEVAGDVSEVIDVQIRTLDNILGDADFPQIDFLSIDVEGFEYDVLQGLTLNIIQPKLLLVEDHLLNLRTHKHIVSQGYQLVKRTVRNNWYIPEGETFRLTSPAEKALLWQKIWVRTPFRKLKNQYRRWAA